MTIRRPGQMWTGVALGASLALVPVFLLAVPAAAQESPRHAAGGGPAGSANAGGGSAGGSGSSGGSSGGGSGVSSSGGGGSTSSSSGGGSMSSGGSGGPSSVRSIDGGGRAAATGGSGIAIGRAVHGAGSESYRSSGGAAYADYTAGRVIAAEPGVRTADSAGTVPRFSRPRSGAPSTGTAVPRGSVPTAGNGISYVNGYGYGYPGYYNGYGYYPYDPSFGYLGYGFGGSLYGGYVDPTYSGSMIGSAYTDPWYGGYNSTQSGSSYSSSEDSALRLKIKPSNAEVFVDGYFVGVVNDFDGMFQRLHIEAGPHRIEVRAPGYETIDIDVRLTSGKTTVYQGELKKIQ